MAAKPGVGYVPNPAVSRAGGGSYRMDLAAHPTAFPPGSPQEQSAMARRYGENWHAAPSNVHTPSILQYLKQDFDAAVASGTPPKWAPMDWKASDWNGKPTTEEADDVLYSGDKRVTDRGAAPAPSTGGGGFGRTRPGGQPPPQPQPPPPAPAPAPQPPPVPPGLSSVEQSVRELLDQLDEGVAHLETPWRAAWATVKRSGLARRALTSAVLVKRRILGESS